MTILTVGKTPPGWALFVSNVLRLGTEGAFEVRSVENDRLELMYRGYLFIFHAWEDADFLKDMPSGYDEFKTWFLKYLDARVWEVEEMRREIGENMRLGEGLVQTIKQCLNNQNASFEVEALDDEVVIKVRVRTREKPRRFPNPIVLPAKI
jgi:hypothetical protein